MFKTIPIIPIDKNRAVPPWEMKTNGTPVRGIIPVIAAMFIKD
jgi:hypothetical protein